MRRFAIIWACLLNLLLATLLLAQSPNGIINGLVLDPAGRVIAGADVVIINDGTGVRYTTKTNGEGIYVLPNLAPGSYRLQVSRVGFKTLIKPDIVLSVQDALSINFTLPIGAFSESLTVEGGAPLVNTESGSVSTVIDRHLVEQLPLNGRSFNTLLQLTPGVVVAPASSSSQGQFSVAGQRTTANNFLIDGVSANFGASPFNLPGTSGTGSSQAFSVLGGTSSLVSVEALQEFRIETSSFAPEFGRSPGGQVLLTTRSGTNDFHGDIYEYFRNDVLDANDWFANHARTPRAPERHNDFGGSLGGPIQRDKTFFFLSYEGARLRQPNTQIIQVPSAFARQSAPASLAPFLNAFPQPDDRTVIPGVFTSKFSGSFSNPASLDVGSLRLDHTFDEKFSLFARYNDAPSEQSFRNNSLSYRNTEDVDTKTLTISGVIAASSRTEDEVRANYSRQRSGLVFALDSFGGAVVPDTQILAPGLSNPQNALLSFISFDTGFYQTGAAGKNSATQLNFADDLTLSRGAHQWKLGADYRAIYLDLRPFQSGITYEVSSIPAFLSTGKATLISAAMPQPAYFVSRATSLYGQDTWHATPRLTLTYGVRWELDPAPAARAKTPLASWQNVATPAALTLAPIGTPLWSTTYTDFAPRLGIAYALDDSRDLIIRGGWGLFYDSASDSAGNLGAEFPNDPTKLSLGVPLPLGNAVPLLPQPSLLPPFPGIVNGFAPNLKLPRSYQWNLAIEKSFQAKQAISITYLGQAGRDLLRQEGLSQPNANFPGVFVLTQNAALSNYDALQLQYRRRVSAGLQALLNYSWSHSLDDSSNDVINTIANTAISAGNDYSSSDFDVRHNFSGALTYSLPLHKSGILGGAVNGWSIETLAVARSGFPFNAVILGSQIGGANPRPDAVPGQPLWISAPSAPGGKSLNPAAFTRPAAGQQGTERRNNIPGFNLSQIDLSLSRQIPLADRLKVLFRADAFNVFNHPNFANPPGFFLGPTVTTFLQSTSMLNQGLGGLNPLFQEGGPRSLQLSLKLEF